jgi:hypothetical protein
MSRERRSNEVPGLADRGYSSFVIGYCLEKPLPPLLGLKMLSQCNGLVFLLLVYGMNEGCCEWFLCVYETVFYAKGFLVIFCPYFHKITPN